MTTFHDLGLKPELLEALDKLAFETPTPIQEKAIPELLSSKRDFVGLAQTGTGKTGAFGLPMLQTLDPAIRQPQGLVICPTRELCLQITEDMKKFSRYIGGVRITAVYGGASIYDQMKSLKYGSQIVAATPGRLCDLIRRGAINLECVSHVVLDEADEMLNMGFQEDINSILETIQDEANTWLFSATMPRGVASIAKKYLENPVEVTIGSRNTGAENIVHSCMVVQERDRYQALRRVLDSIPNIFSLVFCRTRRDTQMVADMLMKDGYQTDALHGDLSQAQRDHVMSKFRNRRIRILVATDVAARGLDVDDITHVINYALPDEPMAYTHRSGRTGRAGKSGYSIALINPRERYRINDLERRGKIRFQFDRVPDGKSICKNQLYAYVEDMISTEVKQEDIHEYLPHVSKLLDGYEKEQLIELLISRRFSHLLKSYRYAKDINASANRKEKSQSRGSSSRPYSRDNDSHFNRRGPRLSQRFFISIGRIDRVKEGAIVRLLCDSAGISSKVIGAIDMKREYSFFEVDKKVADKVDKGLKNATFDGKPVKLHPADSKTRSYR